eukprot:gene3332-3609_t
MAPSPAVLRADTLVRSHPFRQLRSNTRGGGHRCCAFGFVQRMLSSQQCSLLQRAEVSLETSCVSSSYPFRVATFNILADGLAQTGDFVKVPISCLQWEYRLPLILQEIRAANADIICLQELNHFDALAAALIPEGYSAFFRAKQPSPALKFGFPADGIALFYRHSRFSCFPEPAGHCFESMDGQPAAQGYVTAQLHDKQSGRCILVAATHLKAKAGADNEQTRVHQYIQQHELGLDSIWEEFTTWKFRSSGVAKRTIDFIWYSKQQLVPTSRWRMLSESEIGPEGLPSRHYPSDHMCVTCELAWKDE